MKRVAAQARLSLHLSKCHIVGYHMSFPSCKQTVNNRISRRDGSEVFVNVPYSYSTI